MGHATSLQADRETAYDDALFESNFPVGIERHYWFRARNGVLHRALRSAEAARQLPPRPRILEVGCGSGVVVEGLHAKGHDILGVELGRPANLGPVRDRITTGLRAEALPLRVRETIDALMFLDVIEHVPDDAALLRETLAAFPRCRAVFVTVPAGPELWSRHDTYYGHYRRYTIASLRASLGAAALEPKLTRSFFGSLYGMARGLKAAGIERQPVLQAPSGKTQAIHSALTAALTIEDRVLGRLPLPGLSLLAVATVRHDRQR